MSKLINKTRLQKFATDFWAKIKERYDVAFKNATISPSEGDEKHITFERINGQNPHKVSLADYARLQDRNAFKKDVSVDDAETKNNSSIGAKAGMVNPSQRSLGARNLSSGLFTDGYVSKFRVYLENTYNQPQLSIHVWAIKKGDTKNDDRTAKAKLHRGTTIPVSSGNGKKWIDIPINEAFEHDTYFVFRTGSSVNVEAISSVSAENSKHVVNLVDTTPPDDANQSLTWAGEITNTTAYIEIFGRIGIADLNKKIDGVSADGSLYVKQDEVSTTSVANKVVRLDGQGKLDANMLPSVAIGEYFEISEFTNGALQRLNHYENGDTVVVTSGADTGSRYLCINKGATGALTNAFIKLNDKNGLVTSVNEKTGAVTLKIEATTDKLQLKVNDEMKSEVEIISDTDIDTIINGLS